ncbi:ATP-dependent RNA helicase [Microbacterium halophytorum]|uniref:ATP-dependent RNA helicase n=1 Tax=Microbacterium halophytorum TaxID=2067568 RepID=UPI001E323A81|nr:ATP-dependent helicase C-terminal domain-containing protein [Microbacterium halophytorum]
MTGAHLFDLDAIGAGLTVASARRELTEAAATGAMVVTAPPGTGKTTFVPPLLANARPGAGRVLVVQPRRVSVRAAARRLAQLDGTPLGGPSGFAVRGENETSAATRVEFLTPGILLRRLFADPGLEGVCAVVVDEVHERSVDADLLLGMLSEVRELREDLVLVAMSATVDATAVAELIGGERAAPVVDVPSPLHPLAIEYAPYAPGRIDARGVAAGFLDHVARTAIAAQASAGADALVFVPAARDVDRVVSAIRALSPGVEALPLHGQLPPREQDRATAGRHGRDDPPRIVVSTALAESSLTVPGVRLVVDAGLSREPRRDSGRGVSGLVTVSASRASADQRSGRAARQGPGRAVRAYSEADYARMPASAAPEIRSADLTDAALALAVWGTPAAAGLRLLTPPPAASIGAAVTALRALGLVDDDGRATDLGTRVARMPAGAREARALLAAADAGADPRSAAEAVAALSGGHRDPGADLVHLIGELRSGRAPGAERWRRDARRLERVAREARGETPAHNDEIKEKPQHRGDNAEISPRSRAISSETRDPAPVRNQRDARHAGRTARKARGATPAHDDEIAEKPQHRGENLQIPPRSRASSSEARDPASAGSHRSTGHPRDAAGLVAALARPEWIARRVSPGSRSYLLASGTRAAVPEASALASSEWLAVAAAQRAEGRAADATGTVIRLAAPLSEADALALGGGLTRSERVARVADGAVRVREVRGLGAIELSSTPVAAEPGDTVPALTAEIRERGVAALPWAPAAAGLRARLGLIRRELGAPWPDVADEALLAGLDEWLTPALPAAGGSLARVDTLAALRGLLPWPEAARLDDLAPERLPVPSGSAPRIAYPDPNDPDALPVVAVKLQEVFGLADTPRLVDGRVPVLFHLLSPGRQPLAVTSDLAGFWNGAYAEARKQMRGRYPKHPWPEDPWSAIATAKTNRALRRG